MVAQAEARAARRTRELPPPPEGIRRANLQFRLREERASWVFSALMNQPKVELYKGKFPEPFRDLTYVVAHNQGQLYLAAAFTLGEEFKERYGNSVGTGEDLNPLFDKKRYPNSEFLENNQGLVLKRSDGEIYGVIARTDENTIVIQRGGQAGQLALSSDTPFNSFKIFVQEFNLVLQRYVSALWKALPEMDQQELELLLDLSSLPEGAPGTYFSTFEIVAGEFRGRPRPIDLDGEIGGYPRVKSLIKALFMDITDPELSRRFGTQPFSNRFVLISGKEGSGKSLFPKALDAMLRAHFGDKLEHFRLPLGSMFTQYGPHTATIVRTVFDHVRENEKRGVPTLLHLDNLEQLTPSYRRTTGRVMTYSPQMIVGPSGAEFGYNLQILGPVVMALRDFGRDLGGESHHLIVYGESRIPREELPEGVARGFRRAFTLNNPSIEDLADILRVQVTTTRKFAAKTGKDPFVPDIEERIARIAPRAEGLNGRDIQQALLNITTMRKAEWDGETYKPISDEDIVKELNEIRLSEGIENRAGRKLGFPKRQT